MNDKENGRINREIGRKIFHLNFINISYRKRGKVPRTQRKISDEKMMKENEKIELQPPKNKIDVRYLRIIILQYSARKINANHPPIYSTLNPDTSSDSPSAKSNGLRFVSAKQLENQRKNKIQFPITNQRIC